MQSQHKQWARATLLGMWLFPQGGCAAVARVQEPAFVVQKDESPYQIRTYGPRIVAETQVEGSWLEAGNEGFRRLASYIFGNNTKRTKVAMTAPVGERDASRPVAMTAPVGERSEGQGWIVSFTMPAEETWDTLPSPKDARVQLREIGPSTVATIQFSGRWTDANVAENTDKLRAWVKAQGRIASGPPEVQRFDPPWKPWFLRRNEVWVPIE